MTELEYWKNIAMPVGMLIAYLFGRNHQQIHEWIWGKDDEEN